MNRVDGHARLNGRHVKDGTGEARCLRGQAVGVAVQGLVHVEGAVRSGGGRPGLERGG